MKQGGLSLDSKFRIILVGPMYSGNVGACARVVANYDIKDFRVVNPQCDIFAKQSKIFAKGAAQNYLKNIKIENSLKDALKGCHYAVAYSRRIREFQIPQCDALRVSDLIQSSHQSLCCALVFGREDGGLTNKEVQACTHLCTFFTSDAMPSLNLSHSVAVALGCIAERLRTGHLHSSANTEPMASLELLETLMHHWRQALVDADIVRGGNPDRILAHIQKALFRANLSEHEVRIFRGYLSKTQVAMGKRGRTKKPTSGQI